MTQSMFRVYRPKIDAMGRRKCGCCGGWLNKHLPVRCPGCQQPVDRHDDHEPDGHVSDDDLEKAGIGR